MKYFPITNTTNTGIFIEILPFDTFIAQDKGKI